MVCKYCGGQVKHRDYTNRIVKSTGGKTSIIKIERVICIKCGRLSRVLPDNIEPYKHYDKDIIDGVKEGIIGSDTYGYENFPSENTMKRWKHDK